jgi:hypothetical protein
LRDSGPGVSINRHFKHWNRHYEAAYRLCSCNLFDS